MSILDQFRNQDFPDQINLLLQIQTENIKEAIPGLFDLYQNPLNDTMTDHMVIKTLHLLLANNERETVKRIETGNLREKKLCINIAGMNRFSSAASIFQRMLRSEKFKDMHNDVFFALGGIRAAESLNLFRDYIHHANDTLSSFAIKTLGKYPDEESIDALLGLIDEMEKVEEYNTCPLCIGAAIEALAAIRTQKAIACLVSRIHHRNATIRRSICFYLVETGLAAVNHVASIFDHGDTDNKILAANVLGMIGHKTGGEAMVRALDSGRAAHPNVRYAIYEAFGNIPFLKGLTCLMDALHGEEDALILMAIVTALDNNNNPGVINRIKTTIGDGRRGEALLDIIMSAKAIHLFEHLYADLEIRQLMMLRLLNTNNPDILSAFKIALTKMEGSDAKDDLQKLSAMKVAKASRNVLAVDDSKAMLNFYGSVTQEMGLQIIKATNGKEALDIMEFNSSFDLIITDMNMPVMDGLELTRNIRKKIGNTKIPIVMVTTESEKSQRDMAKSAGVDAFVTKPFTMQTLKEALNPFLCV